MKNRSTNSRLKIRNALIRKNVLLLPQSWLWTWIVERNRQAGRPACESHHVQNSQVKKKMASKMKIVCKGLRASSVAWFLHAKHGPSNNCDENFRCSSQCHVGWIQGIFWRCSRFDLASKKRGSLWGVLGLWASDLQNPDRAHKFGGRIFVSHFQQFLRKKMEIVLRELWEDLITLRVMSDNHKDNVMNVGILQLSHSFHEVA